MQRGYNQNPYPDPLAAAGSGQPVQSAANQENPYAAGAVQNPYVNANQSQYSGQNPYVNQNQYSAQNPYMNQGQLGGQNPYANQNPYVRTAGSPYTQGQVQNGGYTAGSRGMGTGGYQNAGFQTGGYAQPMSQTYGSQGYVMPQHAGSFSAPVPQASLYTGPVPMTSSTSVPTPQMTREGLAVQATEPFSIGKMVRRYWMFALALLIVASAVVLFVVLSPGQSRYDAKNVLEAMYLRNMPIVEAYDFTEETDPDHLLNQPGMYTSKAGWVDANLTGRDSLLDRGGFIEVFDTMDQAQKRLEQLKQMDTRHSGFLLKANRVVMRLSADMDLSQKESYEAVLANMFGLGK